MSYDNDDLWFCHQENDITVKKNWNAVLRFHMVADNGFYHIQHVKNYVVHVINFMHKCITCPLWIVFGEIFFSCREKPHHLHTTLVKHRDFLINIFCFIPLANVYFNLGHLLHIINKYVHILSVLLIEK